MFWKGCKNMACVSTRYYGKLYETVSRIFPISIVRPPKNTPKAAFTPQKKIAGYAFVAAPIFVGTLIGSTSEFGAAQAQQASAGGALPQIDVTAQPSTTDIQSTPMLQQTPQLGLTGTKVSDLPLSVKVVPSQLVTQQGGTNVRDALRDVSGTSTGGADAIGGFDRFLIRGMDARIYEDGFSDGEQVNGIPHSINGVQSIEVLKGPGSALLGSGPPGGSINITHYLPSSTFSGGAGVQYGSFNTINSNYWLTGPTLTNGLNYRVDATVSHSDGFRSLKSGDYEIRPELSWNLGDHFITFSVDARRILGTPDTYGLIYFHGRPIDVSRYDKFSTPFSFADQTYIRTELSDAWTISNFLTLNNRFSYLYRDASFLRNNDSGTVVGDMFTGRAIREQHDQINDFDYMLEPVWKFSTWSARHTLVTGFEAQHQTLFTNQAVAALLNITDIFAPIIPETFAGNLNFTRSGSRGLIDSVTANYFGLYATDQIDATDKLKLRFSVRQNWWNSSLTPDVTVPGQPPFGPNQPFLAGETFTRNDQPTDWTAGALYKLTPFLSPYFGVSESHLANFSAEAPAASVQAPEAALQYEAGIKVDGLDNRLEFTLAGFNVDRQNVFTLVNDIANFGNQYTRGVDADLQYSVTPDWKILANGTLQRAVLTANPSNTAAVGRVPIGVPLQIANLWTTYNLEQLRLPDVTTGFGVEYRGKIFGDQLNTDEVPSYVIFDANVTYTQPKWDLGAGIKNIANTLYFTAANGAGAFVGDPRTFYVKADVKF
jgi:iron complex outermembrane recepter protein